MTKRPMCSFSTTGVRSLALSAAMLACLAGTAQGQDSVTAGNGLPGDAPSAYTLGAGQTQILSYVVDLATISSSWGNQYVIGPAVKSSRSTTTSPVYFNHLIGASVISPNLSVPQPFFRLSYASWTAPGGGVNSASNNTALNTPVSTIGAEGQQFGLSFMEFAGGPNATFGDGDDDNNIIAGVVAFKPGFNERIYVSRIVAATNKSTAGVGLNANASFGLGGIDSAGNVAFLGDGQNITGGSDPLSNKQIFRVAAQSRSTSFVNLIGNSTFGDATPSRRLLSTATTQTTPTIIPAAIAARPVVITADFLNAFLAEQVANSLSSASGHLTPSAQARGPISYTPWPFARTSNAVADAGTCAVLSRATSTTRTRGMSAWGVNTNGSVDTALRVEMPTDAVTLVDPVDAFNPASTYGSLANQEFMNYQSQVCFRGANGPVAHTTLPAELGGDLLLAAGVAATGGGSTVPQSMDNYIAVARVNSVTGTTAWTIAAHSGGPTGSTGFSKAILAGPGGSTIGRIARYNEVFPTATSGPSISAPGMDRFGNIYFMSTVRLFGSPQDTLTVGLLRANFDPANNGYQLELLARLDQVVPGLNSGRNYSIAFFGPADADSVDSGAVWHSSVLQDRSARVHPTAVPGLGKSITLGVLTFRAKIIYDIDNNATYSDPSTPPGGTSFDQAYNVQMVVMPKFRPADIAATDGSAGSDGNVDNGDFSLFFTAFFSGDPSADIAGTDSTPGGDGNVDNGDFSLFFTDFFN